MARDQLIAWLNDAYAMEQGLLPILESHERALARTMPESALRIREHISETRLHANRLEECLTLVGTTPSAVKANLSYVMGVGEGFVTAMFSDELVKNALMDFASEQFEVGAYTALVATAEEIGEMEVARLCEDNRREDQLMAAWLEREIPNVVADALERAAAKVR